VRVLVDTPIWSLALRRHAGNLNPNENKLKQTLTELIREGRILMIGPVRQELLSGLREDSQFNRLRDDLRPFKDEAIQTDDYEEAARMSNLCSSRGVASSSVDMLNLRNRRTLSFVYLYERSGLPLVFQGSADSAFTNKLEHQPSSPRPQRLLQ
jgi:hypothetical protein